MTGKLEPNKMAAQIGPNYSFVLPFEENFDSKGTTELFIDTWYVPFLIVILFYLPFIYIGQMIMRKYERFNLRIPMMLWNGSLALMSIVGFIRTLPELLHVLKYYGFQHTICNNSYIYVKPAQFWFYIFTLSKIVELGDTLFLVLRKQKLLFLHVYHHATVLVFTWFGFGYSMAVARWFAVINLGIHSVMYTYYVLKALPNIFKVPRWISMLITCSQITQMVVGATTTIMSYRAYLNGSTCHTSSPLSIAGILMYVSYLILFLQFFIQAYFSKGDKKSAATVKKHE